MINEKPMKKAFACGGALFAVIVIILVVAGITRLSHAVGYVGMNCCMSSAATGIGGLKAKKKWLWGDYAARVIGFVLLIAFLAAQGRAKP